jgi:hypothetical protein
MRMFGRAAGVVVLVLLATGAGGAAGSPAGTGAAAAHLHVRIKVPFPGDVVVARIVVRARPGIGVPVRLRLRALNADRISPTIAAVGGVVGLHRRPFKYVTTVVMVNRRMPHPRPSTPYDRFLDVDLVNAMGATPADARQYFGAHIRVAWNIIAHFGAPRQQALLDLFQPVDADAETPLQRALAERGLDAIPLAGLPARSTSSRQDTAPPTAVLTDVTDVAKSACANDAAHTESAKKKVEGDLATTLNPVGATPSGTKRCDLSRYSFKNLKLSYSAPNAAGVKAAFAVSNVAGSVCGDPAKTAWSVTFASTGEGTRTAQATFSAANPYTIASRTFASGSSIAIKLEYATDSSPAMKISGTAKGKVANVAASPAQAALASTAVAEC